MFTFEQAVAVIQFTEFTELFGCPYAVFVVSQTYASGRFHYALLLPYFTCVTKDVFTKAHASMFEVYTI